MLKFFYIDVYIFRYSNIKSATLHVPSSAISYYQTTAPWSGFGTIKALEGTEAETKKCEKPVISYANGELDFTCSTERITGTGTTDSQPTNQRTCPCATRRTSIYKGLATFHIRCSRNCQQGHGDRYIGSLFRADESVPDDSLLGLRPRR